ncbi:MAG: histidine kinase [Dictyoglomus sp. NZ13-RE01]|nr:MAG: histidine kinase [Dictyoglomus sp. NZ13-RE01]
MLVKEILEDVYLIRTPEFPFFENTYLVRLGGKKRKINLIIDPSPLEYFNDLVLVIKDIIGKIEDLDIVYVNHQDPDLTSSVPGLLSMNKDAVLITSEDTWRLMKSYGIEKERYQPVEHFPNRRLNLDSGEFLEFVPTPFCHFRGAAALYLPSKKILFSGDLFAGLSTKNTDDIFADKNSWAGIKAFHQIYMPSKPALVNAIDNIGRLSPLPEIIAPQHGDIIKGDLIIDFSKRINDLEVGLEYIQDMEKKKDLYIYAFNEIYQCCKERLGEEFVREKVHSINSNSSFPELVQFENDVAIDFRVPIQSVFELMYLSFIEGLNDKEKDQVKSDIIRIFAKYNLEVPETFYEERSTIFDAFKRITNLFRR